MADSVQIYLRTDRNNSKSANLMDPSYIKQLIKMFIFFRKCIPVSRSSLRRSILR